MSRAVDSTEPLDIVGVGRHEATEIVRGPHEAVQVDRYTADDGSRLQRR